MVNGGYGGYYGVGGGGGNGGSYTPPNGGDDDGGKPTQNGGLWLKDSDENVLLAPTGEKSYIDYRYE